MSNDFNGFTKENLNEYFNDLSKELKKDFGRKANIELIVVGGASILLNYGFRESTSDVDAFEASHQSIKDTINRVGDRHNLPNGWINSDFKTTLSFSPRLAQVSKPFKTYNQVLSIRTVTAEYLIAMKLASFRPYKTDSSDVIGIIQEHKKAQQPIIFDNVDKAVTFLYNGWDKMPEGSQDFIKNALSSELSAEAYIIAKEKEDTSKTLLRTFEKDYPDVLNSDNLNSILDSISKKSNSPVVEAPLFSRAAQKSFSEAAKANAPEQNGKGRDDIGIE